VKPVEPWRELLGQRDARFRRSRARLLAVRKHPVRMKLHGTIETRSVTIYETPFGTRAGSEGVKKNETPRKHRNHGGSRINRPRGADRLASRRGCRARMLHLRACSRVHEERIRRVMAVVS